MKRYKQFINEGVRNMDDWSDDELSDRIKHLSVERNELNDEISYMNKILSQRSTNSINHKVKSWSKDIFKLNKEQLEFIFEHHHHSNPTQYKISQEYLNQLYGFISSGFNVGTNEFAFILCTDYLIEERGDKIKFLNDPNVLKSFEFLVHNLKKSDAYPPQNFTRNIGQYVPIKVQYSYCGDYNDYIAYCSDDEIYLKMEYSPEKKLSISEIFEKIVEKDIESIDDEEY
jgi:hypothetical protein